MSHYIVIFDDMNNVPIGRTTWIPVCYQPLTHIRPQLLIRRAGFP